MRSTVSIYFLKEYGSWSVLIIAYLTGLIASRGFNWTAAPVFLAIALLVNSKQAFTRWTRGKGDSKAVFIFLGHIAAAAAILLALFNRDVLLLLPLLVIPAAYLLMNRFTGEHFLLTEVLGFALISLAAVLAKFSVVHGVDVRLYVAVAVYFIAGVFKVKTLLRKKMLDRVLTVLFVVFAVFAYRGFHLPLLILLPLIDNLIVAATPYRVKLQTTGWIEVAKSLLFLALMAVYY